MDQPTDAALVIGVGNPLRGDDGVAHEVLARLEARLEECLEARDVPAAPGGGGTVLIVSHQLLPEHAEAVARARVFVLVDAAADLPPGRVAARPLAPGEARADAHRFDAPGLLAAARDWFGRCPPAHAVGVGAAQFELGAPLSAEVAAAVDPAAAEVLRLLGQG